MKYYNPKFIKNFIEQHKDEISSVEIGMNEDWRWTAETIFSHGAISPRYDWNKDRIEVTGIEGSCWATPVMAVTYKDGREERVDCWVEDGETINPADIAEKKAFAAATGGMDRRFW